MKAAAVVRDGNESGVAKRTSRGGRSRSVTKSGTSDTSASFDVFFSLRFVCMNLTQRNAHTPPGRVEQTQRRLLTRSGNLLETRIIAQALHLLTSRHGVGELSRRRPRLVVPQPRIGLMQVPITRMSPLAHPTAAQRLISVVLQASCCHAEAAA
jgi:hypothetical protein